MNHRVPGSSPSRPRRNWQRPVTVVCCIVLLALSLPLVGNLTVGNFDGPAGTGSSLTTTDEEPHAPVFKRPRRASRGFSDKPHRSPAMCVGCSRDLAEWPSSVGHPALVSNSAGSICRHDFRDGLGAPLLC